MAMRQPRTFWSRKIDMSRPRRPYNACRVVDSMAHLSMILALGWHLCHQRDTCYPFQSNLQCLRTSRAGLAFLRIRNDHLIAGALVRSGAPRMGDAVADPMTKTDVTPAA